MNPTDMSAAAVPHGNSDSIQLYDLMTAQRFLDALEPGGQFAFQTFADPPGLKNDGSLIRVRHGTLTQHADELRELSSRGAGVFALRHKERRWTVRGVR